MFAHIKSYKSSIIYKKTYVLETKTRDGIRGERIHKVVATSISEAIHMFAMVKRLRPDQLIELFSVYEQPTDGKWPNKKGFKWHPKN